MEDNLKTYDFSVLNGMGEEKKVNLHKGHRQKLKNQFYAAGMDHMPDHMILEMLLFFGIPQKDTNELAHMLINKFGSFSGVLRADFEDLKDIKGMTENAACLIKMILPIYKRYVEDLKKEDAQLFTAKEIVEYMRPMYAGTYDEKVFLLCFDSEHKLIATHQIGSGDVSQAFFSMRKIASIVLANKTRDVVLVHNHPYTIALPSSDDVRTTKRVYDFLKMLKVRLSDHIIISDVGFCSMISYPKYAHIFLETPPIDHIEE